MGSVPTSQRLPQSDRRISRQITRSSHSAPSSATTPASNHAPIGPGVSVNRRHLPGFHDSGFPVRHILPRLRIRPQRYDRLSRHLIRLLAEGVSLGNTMLQSTTWCYFAFRMTISSFIPFRFQYPEACLVCVIVKLIINTP